MISGRRRERLVQSNLIASAAASGAGASDPTILDLQGDIAAEGEYRALTALYQGEERARSMETQARLRPLEGAQVAKAGRSANSGAKIGAFAPVLSSAGSLYGRATWGERGGETGGI